MEKIIDKISSYNILNNLIPGAIFVGLCRIFGILAIATDNVLEELALVYFCGMTLSRIGSLIVEPICLKLKIVSYCGIASYAKAEIKDNKLNELLAASNIYRTMIGSFLTMIIIKLYLLVSLLIHIQFEVTFWLSLISLLIIYILSFRKQNKHVINRVDLTSKE